MTLDELGDRLFATVPQAASILERDPRTIRKAAEAGDIPACRAGAKWLIPTNWIRAEAGLSTVQSSGQIDYDKLTDLVNRQANAQLAAVFARLATIFGAESGAA